VDDAVETVLRADRHLHRHRVRAQARLQLLDDLVEVGAGAVHLVDERKARHLVLVGLAPHGLGLRLHAADRAQHEHRAVEHAQRTLDLDGEVDVPGGIDDVEAVLPHGLVHARPERRGGGGRAGDAALLLLLHPVHRGGSVMDFADLVADTRVEQDALGRGGLAGIDVGHDAEVAVTLDGSGAGHGGLSSCARPPCGGPGSVWMAATGRRRGWLPAAPAGYQRACAKALLASAMRWVSSRFLIAPPRFSEASISSPASLRGMVFSPRLRAESISQRIASAMRRDWRTSTGTW